MARRRRLDIEMVRRGIVPSRARASAAIEEGSVLVSGAVAEKPSRLVAPDEPITLARRARYVSRGGDKLAGALDRFGLDPSGKRCLDAGSSTGGFTDCLLQRGATAVVAVDVGRGQLDASLRANPRVHLIEGQNARDLTPVQVEKPVELVTADLSFIGLALVAPALARVADLGADFVFLVKPQFEAGPRDVPRGGVIRDPATHRRVLTTVIDALEDAGLYAVAVAPSPLRGADGNVEFFCHLVREPPGRVGDVEVAAAVDEAQAGPRKGS